MYSVWIIEVRNNIESRYMYMYSVWIIEVRIIKVHVHVQCTDN